MTQRFVYVPKFYLSRIHLWVPGTPRLFKHSNAVSNDNRCWIYNFIFFPCLSKRVILWDWGILGQNFTSLRTICKLLGFFFYKSTVLCTFLSNDIHLHIFGTPSSPVLCFYCLLKFAHICKYLKKQLKNMKVAPLWSHSVFKLSFRGFLANYWRL